MRYKANYCSVTLALVALMPLYAQTNQSNDYDLHRRTARGFGAGMRVIFTHEHMLGAMTFNNIPRELRTVPSNRYGPLALGVPVTVPDAQFDINNPNYGQLSTMSFFPQYTIQRITFRGGMTLVLPNRIEQKRPSTDIFQLDRIKGVNQGGTSSRGYGASLVYYSVYWDNQRNTPLRPFIETEFRVHRFVSLIAGYGGYHKTAEITLENGYDQFDTLAVYSKHTVATVSVSSKSPYFFAKVNLFGPFGAFLFGVTPITTQISSPIPTVTGFSTGRSLKFFMGMDLVATKTRQ